MIAMISKEDVVDKSCGEKVKNVRIAKDMTLKTLSGMTGLSVSHLSKFEHGLCSLSVYSFERVADALETSLAYFLDSNKGHEGFFMRSYEFNPIDFLGQDRLYNRLGNSLDESVLEPMLVTLLPGGDEENIYPKPHQGEEFIFVLEGILTVLLGEECYTLNPGDSMHYQASEPHDWANLSKYIVRLVSINTPRVLPI